MKWKEISDLPEEFYSLRDQELESLFAVWNDEKKRLGDDRSISEFNDQLAREWAIETGIIEGVYTLDRGITQTLIERGIHSSYISHQDTNRDPELVARIIQAHQDVLEGLFSFIKRERALSTGYIKELHAALLRHQETVVVFDDLGRSFETALEKGAYKRLPNNPTRPDGLVHEYSPPEHVASEMDRLVEFHHQHMTRGVPPQVEAAWLHHAFTQIHPFQDGNGRVARAIASLVLIKAGYFPLTITRDDRARYIESLEAADQGELSRLVDLFALLQKRALTKAIVKAVDVRPVATVEDAVMATRDMLVNLEKIPSKQQLRAKQIGDKLADTAQARLEALVTSLRQEIGAVNEKFFFSVELPGEPPIHELHSIGEKLKYTPNANLFHRSARVWLRAQAASGQITVSFHGVGAAMRGLLVAAAYFQVGDAEAVPISEDVFRISYHDSLEEIQPRFEKWLDAALIEGIAQWRRTLV
jgi:prophage maintenance system killer protein